MLTSHVLYWIRAITATAPGADATVELSAFDSPVLEERLRDTVLEAFQPVPEGVTVRLDPSRQRARGYYSAGALRIEVDGTEIGDGGFTDWTARLMADNKERCLVSCISTERLTTRQRV